MSAYVPTDVMKALSIDDANTKSNNTESEGRKVINANPIIMSPGGTFQTPPPVLKSLDHDDDEVVVQTDEPTTSVFHHVDVKGIFCIPGI